MKTILLLMLTAIGLSANEIELTPIQLNLNRIEVRNDTILTYGDCGSLLLSLDAGETWEQIKAFDKGVIQHIFWDGKRMTAFSDYGDVAVSSEGASNWKTVASLNDSVFAVIRYPKGYFIRSDKKIFTITNDYKRIDEFPFASGYIAPQLPYQYRKSVVWFKNNFILSSDYTKCFKFNEQLELTDSISIKDLGLCEKCSTYYQLDTEGDFAYLKVDNIIYRTTDLKNIDTFLNAGMNYLLHKVIENKIHVITLKSKKNYILSIIEKPDSVKILNEFKLDGFTLSLDIHDLQIEDSTVFLIGDEKIGRAQV